MYLTQLISVLLGEKLQTPSSSPLKSLFYTCLESGIVDSNRVKPRVYAIPIKSLYYSSSL